MVLTSSQSSGRNIEVGVEDYLWTIEAVSALWIRDSWVHYVLSNSWVHYGLLRDRLKFNVDCRSFQVTIK